MFLYLLENTVLRCHSFRVKKVNVMPKIKTKNIEMMTTFCFFFVPSLGSSKNVINIHVDLCYLIIAKEIKMTTGSGQPAYSENLFDAKIK